MVETILTINKAMEYCDNIGYVIQLMKKAITSIATFK